MDGSCWVFALRFFVLDSHHSLAMWLVSWIQQEAMRTETNQEKNFLVRLILIPARRRLVIPKKLPKADWKFVLQFLRLCEQAVATPCSRKNLFFTANFAEYTLSAECTLSPATWWQRTLEAHKRLKWFSFPFFFGKYSCISLSELMPLQLLQNAHSNMIQLHLFILEPQHLKVLSVWEVDPGF